MRYSQSVLRALTAAALAAPLVAGSIVGSVSPAAAAVYTPQQALPAPTIQQFLANPSGLLSQFPNGGPDLAKMVRDLAASDPQTLSALIGLLRGATPEQASAIGTGLGQAAELAVNTDPGLRHRNPNGGGHGIERLCDGRVQRRGRRRRQTCGGKARWRRWRWR